MTGVWSWSDPGRNQRWSLQAKGRERKHRPRCWHLLQLWWWVHSEHWWGMWWDSQPIPGMQISLQLPQLTHKKTCIMTKILLRISPKSNQWWKWSERGERRNGYWTTYGRGWTIELTYDEDGSMPATLGVCGVVDEGVALAADAICHSWLCSKGGDCNVLVNVGANQVWRGFVGWDLVLYIGTNLRLATMFGLWVSTALTNLGERRLVVVERFSTEIAINENNCLPRLLVI